MADVDKCPHRWMHGVMTCPHCGNNDRSGTDVAALRAQLDDWRQFGFAQVGPPITCDQDLIDGIDKQLRQQADRIRALEAELAELRKRDDDVRTVLDSKFIVSVGYSFDVTNRSVSLWGKNCPDEPFTDGDVMKALSAAATWLREQKKGAGGR